MISRIPQECETELSEGFIEPSEYPKLSESFIDKHADKLTCVNNSEYPKLFTSM